MSPHSTAHGLWLGPRDPSPARERLCKAVGDLTRARRLQVLVDCGFAGLLAGLVLVLVVFADRRRPAPRLAGVAAAFA